MKLAIVSDIHGNLPALLAVVADAQACGVQGWLNLGDILSGPLWPAETADWLMQQHWPTIAGNHERQVLRGDIARMGASDRYTAQRLAPAQRAWLQALPPQMQPQPGLLCVHGTPSSDLIYLMETVAPDEAAGVRAATPDEIRLRLGNPLLQGLLLCGHSHVPRDVDLGSVRVVNPGSVGLQAYEDAHPHAHRIEVGSPQARYALIEQQEGCWQVDLRAVDYDHESAARQAEAQGRGDWADALRTGRVGRSEADAGSDPD